MFEVLMFVLPVHPVKDACRFALQTAGSLWLVIGNTSPWGSPYSDTSPPTEVQQSTIISPVCAIPAQAKWVVEVIANIFTLGGTAHTGDDLHITLTSSKLAGSPLTISYTMLGGDTLSTAATALALAINTNSTLIAAGVIASVVGPAIMVVAPKGLLVSFSQSVTGTGATTTITRTLAAATDNPGDYTVYDSVNNPRYFNRVLEEAAAILNSVKQLMLLANISGSDLLAMSATTYRQIGFATDLVPVAGHESENPLPAAHIASYGDLETLENSDPVTVLSNVIDLYAYVLQY